MLPMVDTPAFASDVSAYPAITIITREKPGVTRITHRPPIDKSSLAGLAQDLRSKNAAQGNPMATKFSWILTYTPSIMASV